MPINFQTVLVAPNKRVQKQWQKEYPGIEVLLSERCPVVLPNQSKLRKVRGHDA